MSGTKQRAHVKRLAGPLDPDPEISAHIVLRAARRWCAHTHSNEKTGSAIPLKGEHGKSAGRNSAPAEEAIRVSWNKKHPGPFYDQATGKVACLRHADKISGPNEQTPRKKQENT